MPLLAAALIVRDEAARLPACLDRLRRLGALLQRTVVHDTGSRDDTARIALRAGAIVVSGAWHDDFGLARTVALDAARSTWALVVDAGEEVVADPARLRAVLEGAGDVVDALVVQVVELGPDGVERHTTPTARLVRPDRVRYDGRIGERAVGRDGTPPRTLAVPRDVLVLRHHPCADPADQRRRAKRDLALADLQVEEAFDAVPDDDAAVVRALYHRARALLAAGRLPEALVDLEHLNALPVPVAERLWGLDLLAQVRLGLGDLAAVDALVPQLRHLGADEPYGTWLRARSLLGARRYAEALPLLRTIERLVDPAGRELDVAAVVEARMLTAARVDARDEALTCCVRLMAELGRAEGLGPVLLAFWGDRPARPLAALLAGTGGARGAAHVPAIAAELRACGAPGPAVADLLVPPCAAAPPGPGASHGGATTPNRTDAART